jgi:hypothetical protein
MTAADLVIGGVAILADCKGADSIPAVSVCQCVWGCVWVYMYMCVCVCNCVCV